MAIGAHEIETGVAAVDIDRDRRLVVRHQQGDGEAFDELYRRYRDRLVTYCARRVGDRDTAEELAQEAFVRALRAMPSFGGERRFYPWMTVIAHRLCIDHHRRNARVEPAAEVDAGAVDADHDAVFASVDHDHLADALARLAPRHREILELREQRGWTYHQIAEHLDVPLTTVEALLHRARKALRREFLSLSRDERGGRLAGLAIGGGLLTRAKGWLAAASPERWAPALGTAAAGTIAIGVLSGPLSIGGGMDPPAVPAPPTAIVSATTTPAPVVVPAPVLAAAPAAEPAAPVAPPVQTAPRAAEPAPAAAVGAVGVYAGPDGTAWAEEQNDDQPVHADVPAVADVGLDPVQIVSDLLDPGGPE